MVKLQGGYMYKKDEFVRTTIFLKKSQRKELKREAFEKEISMSELIRDKVFPSEK